MAGETVKEKEMNKSEILSALKDQHKAIDWLLAKVIASEKDFYPSKSPVWPLLLHGNKVINALESES